MKHMFNFKCEKWRGSHTVTLDPVTGAEVSKEVISLSRFN